MSEVSVSIKGRDDGLGDHLRSLRQEAVGLGRDLKEMNNWSNMTDTQRKVAVNQVGEGTLRSKQSGIKSEYADLRSSNLDEFYEQKRRMKDGDMSKVDFDKYAKVFNSDQKIMNDEEKAELLQVEKEMNETLKNIHAELSNESKIEREKAQRDKSEFRDQGGVSGQILNENKELRKQQFLSTSESEIAELQQRIDSNNKRLSELKRPEDGRSDNSKSGGMDMLHAAGAAGSGDLMGAVGGGLRGMGNMTGMVKGLTIAGIVAMIVKETLGHGDKLMEAVAPAAAFRGGSSTQASANARMRSGFNDRFDFGAIGMDNEEFSNSMRQKAMASGISGNDLEKRTYDDTIFNKAFGADSGIFSEFERFSKGQEQSTSIALDVLNVLTSIDSSSLKENDLTTLTEKLQGQQTIMSLQRQKRDLVDSDSALKVLAAFESIGLSQKGERASGFLNRTIQGLGEGGGDTEMLLKMEAVKRANPEMTNDPAALRREVRYNSDNPEYISKFFEMIGEMSQGNDMAKDDLLQTFFNPESLADLNRYKEAMEQSLNGGSFNALLNGEGLDKMKQRKGTLDEATMKSDAESGVGSVTEIMKDFSNNTQSQIDQLKNFVMDMIMGKALNVNVVTDKTKPRQSSQIVGNQAKSGE